LTGFRSPTGKFRRRSGIFWEAPDNSREALPFY
jgi:hypothetical protein